MAQEFDPYYTWLGIPPSERPADHYRLLGVPRFETNADVISNAADARMAFVRTFQTGPKGKYTQQILNELAAARTTLLQQERKSAYDQQLKATVAAREAGAAVLPVAAALPAENQQVIMNDLARQMEAVKVREALLAQHQAQYAAALAEAEALRRREQAAAATPVARPVAQPLPAIVTAPVTSFRKPVRRSGISLPLVVAVIAAPIVLLGLVIGYLLSRGEANPSVAEKPNHSTGSPSPKPKPAPKSVEKPAEKPNTLKPAVDKKPPVVPVTRQANEVDLLALVERPRDVPLGEVVRTGGVLSIRRRGGFTCAVVPHDMPSSYELDLHVTPREGEGLLIGVPIGGRRCMLTIDGFANEPPDKKTRTALETIDGHRPHDANYPGEPYVGKLLQPNVESKLTIRVASNSLTLTCDGKQIIRWSGDPARLGVYGLFNQGPPQRMFIGSWAASYDVDRLALRPLADSARPATGKAIDLLAGVQVPRDVLQGAIAQENGGLSIRYPEGGGLSRVDFPQLAPSNYQLDLRVTPRGVQDSFLVGLSVGGRPCLLVIDGYRENGEPKTALESIDGARAHEQKFAGTIHKGRLLPDGVESSVSIRVVGGTVDVTCNDEKVLSWSGDPNRLSIHPTFGLPKDRGLFVGSWSAAYHISKATLQPLAGPTIVTSSNGSNQSPQETPIRPSGVTTDDRPWRWGRFHPSGSRLLLSPNRERALLFQSGRDPWTIQPIDLATGELGAPLEGSGSIESDQSLGLGPDNSPLIAFSVRQTSGLTSFVKSLGSERKKEREYEKQLPDMRYAFSADGKYLAASAGPRIRVMLCDTARNTGLIDPLADMRGAVFVDRLQDDEGTLLVLYTIKKNGGAADHRAVAYDWKSRRPKRSRDFKSRNGNIRGLHFEGDDLWVWGVNYQRGDLTIYPPTGQGVEKLRLGMGQSVCDVDIAAQNALITDTNAPRLLIRSLDPTASPVMLEYSSSVADARFVEQGKAIVCQPRNSSDPLLLWESPQLLEKRRVTAPTLRELGLDGADQQNTAKAVQRSELNATRSTSTSSQSLPAFFASVGTPDREAAKAELSKLRVPLPGGAVKFLNIQSDEFTEEHARLLLAFPELDGLHLHGVRPTTKMLEHLAQLPALKNLGIFRSPLTDEHLAGLAKAKELVSLQLHETQVQGEGLKHLVDVPLRNFNTMPRAPNLAGFQALGQIKSLEYCPFLGTEECDAKLAAISDLPNLRSINLSNVPLSGAGLRPLQKLTSLTQLDLPQSGLTDDDLRPLQSLTNLQSLAMPNSVGDGSVTFMPDAKLSRLKVGAGITDAGLLAIAKKYPGLHTCDLSQSPQITDKGIGHLADQMRPNTIVLPPSASVAMYEQLARVMGLKRIEQFFQSPTAAHLAPLRKQSTLEELQLNKVDDEALGALAQLTSLKSLHINEPFCKAKGLEQLAKASNLERLTLLNGNTLREYGADEAAALEKLTQLKQLNIFGTSLDPPSIVRIKETLAKTQVQIVR
jgi:hypothetical protein